jgi:hypothetical protein
MIKLGKLSWDCHDKGLVSVLLAGKMHVLFVGAVAIRAEKTAHCCSKLNCLLHTSHLKFMVHISYLVEYSFSSTACHCIVPAGEDTGNTHV